MDVSGWTLAQKMELPDWCFGSRKLMGVSQTRAVPGATDWVIHTTNLPLEICIWQVRIFWRHQDDWASFIRMGFRATVPVNTGQMDTAIPILPDFGNVVYTPPRIHCASGGHEVWAIDLRKGMNTGAHKMVMEMYVNTDKVSVIFTIVFSELPTEIPAHLDPNTV